MAEFAQSGSVWEFKHEKFHLISICNFVWLSQKITLFGLQPFEEYEVAVLAFNSVGEGPAVKKLIRTAEGSKIYLQYSYTDHQ